MKQKPAEKINPNEEKYTKMDYEVEIKRLETKLNEIEQYLSILIIAAISFGSYQLVTSIASL
jgi:hypothetical protein